MPDTDQTAAADPAAAPAEAPAKPAWETTIDSWFAEHVQNSVITQYTPAYNALLAAVDNLKARFRSGE